MYSLLIASVIIQCTESQGLLSIYIKQKNGAGAKTFLLGSVGTAPGGAAAQYRLGSALGAAAGDAAAGALSVAGAAAAAAGGAEIGEGSRTVSMV